MTYPTWALWTVITCLGVGTYLIRISFLGLIGGRKLPEWLLRHLRYAPHAVLPAMIAPMLVWPAHDANPLPGWVAAVTVALVGWLTRNTLAALLVGAAVLAGGIVLAG